MTRFLSRMSIRQAANMSLLDISTSTSLDKNKMHGCGDRRTRVQNPAVLFGKPNEIRSDLGHVEGKELSELSEEELAC